MRPSVAQCLTHSRDSVNVLASGGRSRASPEGRFHRTGGLCWENDLGTGLSPALPSALPSPLESQATAGHMTLDKSLPFSRRRALTSRPPADPVSSSLPLPVAAGPQPLLGKGLWGGGRWWSRGPQISSVSACLPAGHLRRNAGTPARTPRGSGPHVPVPVCELHLGTLRRAHLSPP